MHTDPFKAHTLDATAGRVGGYLIVWGDPRHRDRQGEYFTPATELGLDWYPVRPVLYHHGLPLPDDLSLLQPAPVRAAIGHIDSLRPDEVGVWATAQLDPDHPYYDALLRLIDDGALSWSSGSLPQLAQVADDGRITRWVIVEGSLTPRPAEPRHTDVIALKSAYHALGLDAGRLIPPDPYPTETSSSGGTPPMPDDPTPTSAPAPRKRLPLADPDDAHSPAHAPAVKSALSVSSPYDHLSAADLLYGYVMLRSLKGFQGVSERYANALAHKVRGERLTALKADELSYSTHTGYGDEWVPDLWSDQLWQKVRADNVIMPLFRAVDMPSNPFELPVEGTDPTVYYVPETRHESQLTLGSGNPIPDSKIGTGKRQLEARKLALRVGFTAELVEDAIVPVLSLYRQQAVRAIADSIDYTLLNGDTATSASTNINDIGGTPAGNERFLAFDGVRKLPLVTATANRVSMGAAPTLAKLRETRWKLGARYAARPSDLAWIVDGNTYAALLALPEFLTMDKAGALATALTGQIGFIDGIPVFVSAELALSDANGKVSTTVAGTKGTALCVYRPGWFVGFRRRVSVNVDYLSYLDSYQLTATVRLAFTRYDDLAASALINITV